MKQVIMASEGIASGYNNRLDGMSYSNRHMGMENKLRESESAANDR
jgi:hypothetical protein